ncbi:MAG: transposase [Acidimicrobiaceae bacterium]|nr:transposase [Acidimicrobiaceae bacterium]
MALERELVARGVRQRHGRPYHPQTQGKVERFHQTLEQWLAEQEPASDVASLQGQLDVFREYYNEFRPHRALGRTTPAKALAARPAALPSNEPIPISLFRTRRDVVGTTGKVTLRVGSRLHHIGIGRAFARQRVILLVHDLNVRVITEDGDARVSWCSTSRVTINRWWCELCRETGVNAVSRQDNRAGGGT